MSITEIAIKRPSLIIVIFTVLTVLGLISYSNLAYELIPKFSAPIVFINTVYPGASPTEVENSVSKVIEEAVSGVEKIVNIRSNSFEGISTVVVEFKQNANVDLALQEAQRKVNGAVSKLPDDAKTPILSKFGSDEFPVVSMGATGNLAPAAFFDLIKQRVKPVLSRIEGVGQINLIGGQEREIRVLINREKLESQGLSVLQVVQVIEAANLEFPTGKIKSDKEQITVRLAGKFQSINDMKNLAVLTTPNGALVKISDIAEVEDVTKEITDLSRLNRRSAIAIQVLKQSDANAVAVSDGVRKELQVLEKEFADENLKFKIANDTTDFTRDAVSAVDHDIMLAILLVALVMLMFLHSLRNSLIVMVAIPASLVSTFIGMYLFGFTLNLMTLLAMSLVIGILVDDSIVVLENIYRHMEMGKDKRKASLDGRNEIAFTALAITMVDVVVFFPLTLTEGIIGNIMRSFAWVVVFSTLMSLFVSFTITPMLASRFSKLTHLNPRNLFQLPLVLFERGLAYLTDQYTKLLEWAIRAPLHRILILVTTLTVFFSSFLLLTNGYIGNAFIVSSDRGEFIMKLELNKDANIQETNLAVIKAENYLAKQPEVTSIFSTIGRTTGVLSGQSTPYLAEVNVKMLPAEERTVRADIYARKVRNELEKQLPGIKVQTSAVSFFGGADESPIQVIVSSSQLKDAMAYANQVIDMAKKVPGALEPKLSVEEGNPEVYVKIDREQMAELGLNVQTVGATMQTAFSGNTNAKYRDGTYEYDIDILLDAFDRRNVEDVAQLGFINNKGQVIRLEQFANITQTTGPSFLERKDRISSVTVRAGVLGRPSGTVGAELQAAIAKNPPPKGVTIAYDGDLKQQSEGFGSLFIAMGSAILFMYLIMVALYDDFVYPFVVLFSIPVATVGAFLAMALAMQTLDIFAMLGLIMLIGLVGKNAILLVDFTNQMKEEGHNTFEALLLAGRIRLRPILMTTIAMVFGMLPIALAKGAGAEWKNALAWALVGGLTSSMFLTLLVVPVVYAVVDSIKALLARLFGKKNQDGGTDAGKMESTPVLDAEMA
jgi:HAE1 family hydrophobic/amphiphilic exporter-1